MRRILLIAGEGKVWRSNKEKPILPSFAGAFEIDFNGMRMWSKIQTGRIPTGPELFQMIESNMEMAGGGSSKFS